MRNLILFLLFPTVFFSQNKSDSFINIIESSINIKKKEQKLDSLLLSYELDNKLNILFYDLYYYAIWLNNNTQNYDKAIEICYKGINISKKLKQIDEDKLAGLINTAGYFYEQLKDYNKAFYEYKKITKSIQLPKRLANAYNRMGVCKRILGDFYEASNYFETSLSIAKKNDPLLYIRVAINASINYKQIATKASFKKGITLITSVIDEIDSNIIKKDNISKKILVQLYNSLGNLYGDRIDVESDIDVNFSKAEKNLKSGLDVAKEINDSKQLGYIYNDIGYLYAKVKKADAIFFLEKAINYSDNIELLSICYSNLALYYYKINDRPNALLNADKAIDILLSNNNVTESNLDKSVYKYELLTALIEKSKLIIKFNENTGDKIEAYKKALQTLKFADYLVDKIKLESSEEKSKLFWRTIASDIYTNATKVSYVLNNPEDAFYFMEKNKAILLLEDVSLQQLKEKNKIPETVFVRQKQLKKHIVELNQNLSNSLSEESKNNIQKRILSTKEEYNTFLDSLSINYSVYIRTQKSTKLIKLNEAKQSLSKKNSSYLSYILNDEIGYGLYISEDKLDFFEIKNIDSVLKSAITYRNLLEVPFKNKTDLETYKDVASKLYNNLIPKSISNNFKGKKIIIIPDSYLQNIPFESLITSGKNNFFIQNNDISYAYSVTFLNENKKIIRENKNQFLGIAPIIFNNELPDLPKSKNEINNISKQFSSQNFIKEKATSTNYINYAKGYDIIHIATHAYSNDSINPWIAFADKKLTLNELYLTENSANLVVLNACKTSLGEINKGEGVMSLARGFFYTGSNSVVSSLWNVNDKSNQEITVNFYKYLKEGKTKSAALRLAKLDYLKTHNLSEASPYYWSSLILIGDDSAIKFQNNLLYYIILGFILVIILIFIIKKIKFVGNK